MEGATVGATTPSGDGQLKLPVMYFPASHKEAKIQNDKKGVPQEILLLDEKRDHFISSFKYLESP
jgi:hypothetical protein